MKFKLMIQSLSPLFLLTIIRNFMFILVDSDGNKLTAKSFISENMILVIVFSICFLWILLSIWFYVEFMAFQLTNKPGGYSIKVIEEKDDASLNFFLTLILPLVIDDVDSWQGAVVFFILITMICILLYKTKLFYANPVLSILGYRLYTIKFTSNSNFGQNEIIALGKGHIDTWIEYKIITGKIIYIKGDTKKCKQKKSKIK